MVFGHTRSVKSHRTGRRRKKGGARLPVAPWILITLVCVLVASALTAGFVTLLRAGCGGQAYQVTIAAAPNAYGALDDLSREWEAGKPEVGGSCVGVEIEEVAAADAARGLSGMWNTKSLGPSPIAWVPDSDVWPEWVSGTEVTAGYFTSEPVILGKSETVIAVPEPVATELGWLGGQPPSWSDILEAVPLGLSIAAADPRTSTEGLQSMLNVVSDGAGGIDGAAMRAYSEALDAGQVAKDAETLFAEYAASEDQAAFADVFTALDYQVEEFNESSDLEYDLVPITPSGADLDAVYPYIVLDGAGWVSGPDAEIAAQFGAYLQTAAAADELAASGIDPVEAGAAGAGTLTGETVREAVREWQTIRRDLNLLIVVDRSENGVESVEYDGGQVAASDAEIRVADALISELGSTSQAGLWEFGFGAGGESNWRTVTELAGMSDDNREALVGDLWSVAENPLYSEGSPLFDTVTQAYAYMSENYVDSADNVIVVLTNGGVDPISAPSIEQTAEVLSQAAGEQTVPVSIYTVGFGEADTAELTAIAEATQGNYIDAPTSGGLLPLLRENLVN